MDAEAAYGLIAKAIAAGRPAHGYLVCGDLRGGCVPLAERVFGDLYPGADCHTHPDVHWVYPEKKSRIVSVDAMHEKLIEPMESTAFSGGWKVGVIVGADRLKKESANAFLKTLEEPPPRTLFFLLTDAPEGILPTIISRCQRIDLAGVRQPGLEEPYRSAVLEALRLPSPDSALARQGIALRLAEILAKLQEKAESLVDEDIEESSEADAGMKEGDVYKALVSARYREFRQDFLLTLSGYFAEEMRKTALGRGSLRRLEAYYNVDAVEELARTFDRNIGEEAALLFFADRVRLPAERD